MILGVPYGNPRKREIPFNFAIVGIPMYLIFYLGMRADHRPHQPQSQPSSIYQDVNYDNVQDKIISDKHNPGLRDTLLGVRLEDKIIYLPKESFE